jgi:DNA gyrase subunit A
MDMNDDDSLIPSPVFSFAHEVIDAPLEDEMRKSYLDYAMSVIVGRALPDARDGLKPVHRRVLFGMHELNNAWNRPYLKSARVVGDVMGKYHPHGDASIYDTLVRMAQDFSLRYLLVDGQGNFGSVDGDSAAAMRYTEARMSKITHQLLADIEKETVDFAPNYDGKEMEPTVLPTRFPNLLLNGSEGIAVGMATKIAPHNLTELVAGCLAMLDDENVSVDELIRLVPAPDFPTGGLVCGLAGAAEAYRSGRGSVVVRAKTHFEEAEKGVRASIVVDELPYQVNKLKLTKAIVELVREKRIEGISNLQDESDKAGMRLVIELKRGELPDVVLNQLFKMTELQITFSMNMVALVDGRPQVLTLKDALRIFLEHRREVIVRRCIHELKKARSRGHLLEGLAVALSNVDAIVAAIRSAQDPGSAREALLGQRWSAPLLSSMLGEALVSKEDTRPETATSNFGLDDHGAYQLSPEQAQEILQMRLQRLTGLEQDRIVGEFKEILAQIQDLLDIIASEARVTEICRHELVALREEFGDARRSEIVFGAFDIEDEDLIPRRDVMVTFSHMGYVKRSDLGSQDAQRRGGRGRAATDLKDADAVKKMFVANSHDVLMCFTTAGRVLPVKVYALPEGARQSRGRPLINYLGLQAGERIAEMLPVSSFEQERFLVFATKKGMVKRTALSEFKTIRAGGLIAIDLNPGDQVVAVQNTTGRGDLMLFCDNNRVNRFPEPTLRTLSRTAKGVRCMRLQEGESIIGMLAPENDEAMLLTVTELGYAKRTAVGGYRKASRGSLGVKAIPTDERIGPLAKVLLLAEGQDVMGITASGVMIRVAADEVRQTSRLAKGVRLLRLDEGDRLVDVCVAEESEAEAVVEAGLDASVGDAVGEEAGDGQ